jgi:hypothetical protein
MKAGDRQDHGGKKSTWLAADASLVFGYFLSLGLTEWNAFRGLYPDSGASRMHKPAMADPCIVAECCS